MIELIEKPLLKTGTVASLFDAMQKEAPFSAALISPTLQLTFGEVNKQSDRVAAHLLNAGAKPGQAVGVFLDRSIDLAIALLAIFKIGGHYLPLDPLLSKSQILDQIEQTKPKVTVVGDAPHGYLEEVTTLIPMRRALQERGAPSHAMKPEQAGYIIFTSGCHTHARGVFIKQIALVNQILWMKKRYNLSVKERALITARPGTDCSIGEILIYLLTGATLYLYPETRDPKEIAALMRTLEITTAFTPTAVAELLVEESWPKDCLLRHLFVSGETMRKRPPKDLPFTLINCYGPSENGIISLEHEVNPEQDALPIPAGVPIPHVKVLIVDSLSRPVQEGEVGELAVGGIALADGYLTKEEDAERRFIIHTSLGKRSERYLLTGDMARWRRGEVECLGKKSRFTESGTSFLEIEANLLRHPAILQAAVKQLDDGSLAAYWSPKSGMKTKEKAIRRYLKERLKECDIPKHFIEMTALPLSKRGKIHYDQLLAPKTVDDDDEPIMPALSGIEKEIVTLWQEKLSIYPLSTEKPLDEIPHTESALYEIARTLSERREREVKVSDLIQRETVRKLAAWIKEEKEEKRQLINWISLVRKNERILCISDDDEEIYPFLYIEEYLARFASFATLSISYSKYDTLERAVKGEIQEIESADPTVIIGIGKGGLVASEIAASLKKQVPLFLIKSTPPCDRSFSKRLMKTIVRFIKLPIDMKSEAIQDLWKALEEVVIDRLHIEWPPGKKREEKLKTAKEGDLSKLLRHSTLSPSTIPAILITSQFREEERCEWKNRFGKLFVKPVEGLTGPFITRKDAKLIASEIKHYLAW